jgi:hypothetical protein
MALPDGLADGRSEVEHLAKPQRDIVTHDLGCGRPGERNVDHFSRTP